MTKTFHWTPCLNLFLATLSPFVLVSALFLPLSNSSPFPVSATVRSPLSLHITRQRQTAMLWLWYRATWCCFCQHGEVILEIITVENTSWAISGCNAWRALKSPFLNVLVDIIFHALGWRSFRRFLSLAWLCTTVEWADSRLTQGVTCLIPSQLMRLMLHGVCFWPCLMLCLQTGQAYRAGEKELPDSTPGCQHCLSRHLKSSHQDLCPLNEKIH